MFRKRRGLVPYRVDTSAQPLAAPPTWRSRLLTRENVRDGFGLLFAVAVIIGGGFLFRAMAPVGENFANFIDRLAGVER